MEAKKSPRVNLEKKKGLFFQIGLIVSLSIALLAFEYKNSNSSKNSSSNNAPMVIDYDLVPITRPEKPELPKPQPVTKIKEIDNDVDEQPDLDVNVETTQHDTNEIFVPPSKNETDQPEVKDDPIIENIYIEEPAQFIGGENAMLEYLLKNTRYPDLAKDFGIEGTVFIQFVVEKDGSITNVKIIRGIGGGCDEEALRVVQNMPLWQPGKVNGRPVRALLILPIKFKLK